jgi:hypothetical protein
MDTRHLFLKETKARKQIGVNLFIIIGMLIFSYSAYGSISFKGYNYTTGKNPAVAASQHSKYFVEVHEARGCFDMYCTVLDETRVIGKITEMPGKGYNPAITYIDNKREFAVVYCNSSRRDENSNDIIQSIGSGADPTEIALTIINPYTRNISKPKIIITGKSNLNPSVTYITTGKYMGCLAVMVGRPDKKSLSLAIIGLDGKCKLTADLGQSGENPAIAFIENGRFKNCLASVHKHVSNKELFMNIINLENISDKAKNIKNEINGKSGSAAGHFYDKGENPTLAVGITDSGEFLIEVHKGMSSESLNMNVFEISSSGIEKIGNYKKYDIGYTPSLTYGFLGLADVHKSANSSNLRLSLIKVSGLTIDSGSPDPPPKRGIGE